jgi:hypothetical protein
MLDNKLFKLEENFNYYKWKYESCHKFWRKEYYDEMNKAKEELKRYRAKHYPQTRLLTQPKPFLSTSEFSENFEEYAN